MGGGSIQLELSRDDLDSTLTGNPQITHFKTVFKRHTNFATESIRQMFAGDLSFGSTVSCTLSRNGDLVNNMYIEACVGIDESTLRDVSNIIYEAVDVQFQTESTRSTLITDVSHIIIHPDVQSIINTFPKLTGTVTQTRTAFTLFQEVPNDSSPIKLKSVVNARYDYFDDVLHMQVEYTRESIYVDYDLTYNVTLFLNGIQQNSIQGTLSSSTINSYNQTIDLDFQFARATSPFRFASDFSISLDASFSLSTSSLTRKAPATLFFRDVPVIADSTDDVYTSEDTVLEIQLQTFDDSTHLYYVSTLPTLGTLYTDSSLESTHQVDTTVGFSGAVLYYVPHKDSNGDDQFTYYVSDQTNENDSSNLVTVDITIDAVNDPPVIDTTERVSGVEDAAYITITLDSTIIDPDDSTHLYYVSTLPTLGTLYTDSSLESTHQVDTTVGFSGAVLYYVPHKDSNGDDQFTYYVSDQTNENDSSNLVTVDITIDAVNDPPVIDTTNENNIFTYSIDEDSPERLQITLPGTDVDDEHLTYVVENTLPLLGYLYTDSENTTPIDSTPFFLNSDTLYYAPRANRYGTDQFNYRVQDPANGTSDIHTIVIDIKSILDPPTATPLSVQVLEDGVVEIRLSGTNTDEGGVIVGFKITDPPERGVLYSNYDGSSTAPIGSEFSNETLYYRPNPNVFEPDTFKFAVVGTQDVWSAPSIVDIIIDAVNDPPTSTSFTVSTSVSEVLHIELIGDDAIDNSQVTKFQITETLNNGGNLYRTQDTSTSPLIAGDTLDNTSSVYFFSSTGSILTQFKYVSLDGQNIASSESTVSINVIQNNVAPIANNVSLTFILIGIGVFTEIHLSGSDQEDGVVQKYKISGGQNLINRLHPTQSTNSTIQVNEEFESAVIYFSHTSTIESPTTLSFTYQTRDSAGVWSNNAIVELRLESKWQGLEVEDISYYEIPYVADFTSNAFGDDANSFVMFQSASSDVGVDWSVVVRISEFDASQFMTNATRMLFYYGPDQNGTGFSDGELHIHVTPDRKLGAFFGYATNRTIDISTSESLENGRTYLCVLSWVSNSYLRLRLDDGTDGTYTKGTVVWAEIVSSELALPDDDITFQENTYLGRSPSGSRSWYSDDSGLSLLVTQTQIISNNSGTQIDDTINPDEWGTFDTTNAEISIVFRGIDPVNNQPPSWTSSTSSGLVVIKIPKFDRSSFAANIGTSTGRILFFMGQSTGSNLYISVSNTDFNISLVTNDETLINNNTTLETGNSYLCCFAWSKDASSELYTLRLRTDVLIETYYEIGQEVTLESQSVSDDIFGQSEILGGGGGGTLVDWYDIGANSIQALVYLTYDNYFKPVAHDISAQTIDINGTFDFTITGSNESNTVDTYEIRTLPNFGVLSIVDAQGNQEVITQGTSYSILTKNQIRYTLTSTLSSNDSFAFVVSSVSNISSDETTVNIAIPSTITIVENTIEFTSAPPEIANIDLNAYDVTFVIIGDTQTYTVTVDESTSSSYMYAFTPLYDSTLPSNIPYGSVTFTSTLKTWSSTVTCGASVQESKYTFDATSLSFQDSTFTLDIDTSSNTMMDSDLDLDLDSSASNFVVVELDEVIDTSINWRMNTNIAHVIFEYIDIEIGGKRIDRHYGEWLEIWNDLTQKPGKRAAYELFVGYTSAPGTNQISIYVPLRFWFCTNPGLALPLISLKYHEVKIRVHIRDGADQLRELGDVDSRYTIALPGTDVDTGTFITPKGDVKVAVKPRILSMSLWVDYIFLEDQERNMFCNKDHEYLIHQLQVTENSVLYNPTLRVKTKLPFVHPVKELVWVVVDSRRTFEAFSSSDGANPIQSAVLYLDGIRRFNERDGVYFDIIQPHQHHTNIPHTLHHIRDSSGHAQITRRGINVYSFALHPEDTDPSGSCNMSRITDAVLEVKPFLDNVDSSVIRVYAVNYNVLRITQGTGGLAFETSQLEKKRTP